MMGLAEGLSAPLIPVIATGVMVIIHVFIGPIAKPTWLSYLFVLIAHSVSVFVVDGRQEALQDITERAQSSKEPMECTCGNQPMRVLSEDGQDFYVLCDKCGRQSMRTPTLDSAIKNWDQIITNNKKRGVN